MNVFSKAGVATSLRVCSLTKAAGRIKNGAPEYTINVTTAGKRQIEVLIKYRGYNIGVRAEKKQDGLWTANAWTGPIVENLKALRDVQELTGFASQQEAEKAGLEWGKKRLNLYAKNKLPPR